MKRRVHQGIERAAEGGTAPQKRYFRQRAHINPLSQSGVYEYPVTPDRMDWSRHYPQHALVNEDGRGRKVEVADIGCGFGGLIMGLAPLLKPKLVLGMEIRPSVTEYVRLRILAARKAASLHGHTPTPTHGEGEGEGAEAAAEAAMVPAHPVGAPITAEQSSVDPTHSYDNSSVLLTNAMKLLPFFFARGQLTHMFFCFPDPHFKRANHRRRIVTTALLAEYAYVLKEGGRLYTITDVLDLHNWMRSHADAHPYFRRLTDEELAADPVVPVMRTYTEEGKKVERNKGDKYVAVFQRLSRAEAERRAVALSHADAASADAAVPADDFDFWSEPPVHYEYVPAPSQLKNLKAAAK